MPGVAGHIVKAKGKAEALALIEGVNAVLVLLNKSPGAGVVPGCFFAT